jgi:multidrug resistance protein
MHKWSALTAVSIGTFMLLVDVTIVTVALPAVSRDLGATLGGLQWVLDGYALALAAVLLASGALADRHGRKKVYLGGTVVFAVASLLCAVAPNAGLLIAARFLQGLGGAAMLATTVAILSVAYTGRDRGVAFGVWGAVNGAAAAAGPIAGGLLTEHFGWRWIFLVNLPVSLLAVWFTLRGITESRGRQDSRLDLPGTVTFTISASAVTFALIRGGDAGWSAPSTLGAFALSAVALAAFIVAERRSEHPMLDLHLFAKPSFSALMVAAVLAQAAAFAYLPFTTVWLQQFLGKGPVDAGRFLQRVPPRWSIGAGLLLIGAGALMQSRLTPSSGGTALIPGLIVVGLGVAAVLPTMASAALATVPHERSGMAGGALNTFRQLGFALGVAVFGSIFAHRLAGHHPPTDAVDHVVAIAGFTALAGAVLVLLVVRSGRPAWESAAPAAPAGERTAAGHP